MKRRETGSWQGPCIAFGLLVSVSFLAEANSRQLGWAFAGLRGAVLMLINDGSKFLFLFVFFFSLGLEFLGIFYIFIFLFCLC